MPRINGHNGCVFNYCEGEVFSNHMCKKHYFWDRYHTHRRHGAAYFFGYVSRHQELANRGKQILRARGVSTRANTGRKRGAAQ